MNKPLDTQSSLVSSKGSKLNKCQQLVVGENSIAKLLKYELITMFTTSVPGALGLLLRGKFYPWLLGGAGERMVFGSGVVLRHPGKVRLDDDVVTDANVVLDAKGETNGGSTLATVYSSVVIPSCTVKTVTSTLETMRI